MYKMVLRFWGNDYKVATLTRLSHKYSYEVSKFIGQLYDKNGPLKKLLQWTTSLEAFGILKEWVFFAVGGRGGRHLLVRWLYPPPK